MSVSETDRVYELEQQLVEAVMALQLLVFEIKIGDANGVSLRFKEAHKVCQKYWADDNKAFAEIMQHPKWLEPYTGGSDE